jgi:sortase (surface protein transpeptidase)
VSSSRSGRFWRRRGGRAAGACLTAAVVVLAVVVLAVVVLAVAVPGLRGPAAAAAWFAPPAAPGAGGAGGGGAGAGAGGDPGPRSGPFADAAAVPAPGAAPTRVRIPAIGVDSPLERLRLDAGGALTPPADFAEAGWYADGTVPGDVGPAVIAGHIDSTRGPAVFFRLDRLHAGDLVEVARGGDWLAFRVVAVDRYPKRAFPTAAVYGPTPDPQLRLITCGGAFDRSRRSYVDNTVVFAVGV